MRHALLLLLLTLATTSCISSDRMLRAMPFGAGSVRRVDLKYK